MDESQPVNVYRTRVRSHQTDLNGAMYHGAYFDVFDDARIDTFRRLGYAYEDAVAGGWRLVIRHVTCEYHAPALMDALIDVVVSVAAATRATLTVGYACRHNDLLLAKGQVRYVFVDGRGRPLRFPADLWRLIEATPALRSQGK